METDLIYIFNLKKGDIFSFRTIQKPIWWRFIEIKKGKVIYEEIRNKYRHSSNQINSTVLKRISLKNKKS